MNNVEQRNQRDEENLGILLTKSEKSTGDTIWRNYKQDLFLEQRFLEKFIRNKKFKDQLYGLPCTPTCQKFPRKFDQIITVSEICT